MKIFIRGAAAAIALSLAGVSVSEAQLTSAGYACMTSELMYMGSAADACGGWFAGNNAGMSNPPESDVIAWINGTWGGILGYSVTGSAGTTEEGESSGPFQNWGTGQNSGTLTFDFPISGNFVVALKGSNAFALYLFTGAVDWESLDFDLGGPGVNKPGLSHATVYGGRFSVAEPATTLLLLTGLLGMSFLAWRRREVNLA